MGKKFSLDMPFLSGMYRGILSIILGLILIFDPDKSEPKLTYIMGMFWLTSGIALLKSDPTGKMSKRISTLISVVAIVTGVMVVAHYFLGNLFGLHIVDNLVIDIVLGAVILLTGVTHFIGEWKFADMSVKRILHLLLAVFEILLGLQLLLLPMVNHLYVRQTVTVWALLGGILFLGTAVYEHRQFRQNKQAADPDGATVTTQETKQ